MINQIFKIIWKQRKSNAWIFAEILLVLCVLWVMVDNIIVNTYVYNLPMGFDINNTWNFSVTPLGRSAKGYIPEEERTTDDTDDLLKLMERIRNHPEVEDVCVSFFSRPYANGNADMSINPIDEDSLELKPKQLHLRYITPEYFTVFRMLDKKGNPITPQLPSDELNYMIASQGVETTFFNGKEAQGRKFKLGKDEIVTIPLVTQPVRDTDYQAPEACLYKVGKEGMVRDFVNNMGIVNIEMSVRMKQDKTEEEMTVFLESMGDLLTVNNVTISGATSYQELRKNHYKIVQPEKEAKNKMALMAFMLVNVFFGIIGTFWLRTQQRRSEMALRMSMGSSKGALYNFMFAEGFCMLLLTIPLFLVFVINIYYFNMIDLKRLSFILWRILLGVGITYTLMTIMITVGIWLPARKAVSVSPAEALRDE